METCQSLSIESFSYSWVVNLGDSFRAGMDDDYNEAAFIELDPTLAPSKRFSNVTNYPQDDHLNFDFPTSDSPLSLVHADELISNGFLMPLFMKMESANSDDVIISDSIPNTTPSSSSFPHNEPSTRKRDHILRCASLRRCRRLSRRILLKYLEFLRPFCQNITRRKFGSRSSPASGRIEDVNKKWDYSPATSPRTSVAYSSIDNCRMSCDSGTSIHEAVLHCKRTNIGN